MEPIVALQAPVTGADGEREPTLAELDAIEEELPLILAEVDLLDAHITTLDRPLTELDAQRIRRARNRVLAVRRDLANRASTALAGGAA
ncbi:DUF6284 family protein [Streptomyces coeruleoprunus]|uniref:DUF6284 family protein n=1 Tax=Streptomyces coeruleoprunus TaxID=285563 RepID=A0ABV9XE62_9ACTN